MKAKDMNVRKAVLRALRRASQPMGCAEIWKHLGSPAWLPGKSGRRVHGYDRVHRELLHLEEDGLLRLSRENTNSHWVLVTDEAQNKLKLSVRTNLNAIVQAIVTALEQVPWEQMEPWSRVVEDMLCKNNSINPDVSVVIEKLVQIVKLGDFMSLLSHPLIKEIVGAFSDIAARGPDASPVRKALKDIESIDWSDPVNLTTFTAFVDSYSSPEPVEVDNSESSEEAPRFYDMNQISAALNARGVPFDRVVLPEFAVEVALMMSMSIDEDVQGVLEVLRQAPAQASVVGMGGQYEDV